jgi:membrane protease YdiL (CAAX protease family)
MSRSLKLLTAGYIFAAALVFVPSAFATAHNGEGIWGPTNDATVMYAMFIVMGLIILMIIVFSLIQTWLERRKYAKMAAASGGAGHGHSH